MSQKIHIIGLQGGWRQGLDSSALDCIQRADLLVGGKRQLALFPEFDGETVPITSNIQEVGERLVAAYKAGECAVVLASGDPLCYGIGSTLRRFLPASALNVKPALSSFQLAFAAIGEPWHDAQLVTTHGRFPQNALVTIMTHAKTAVLTDQQNTPTSLSQTLLDWGLAKTTRCAVCEQLGSRAEQIHDMTVGEAAKRPFDPLNVFIVFNDSPIQPQPPGLPDDAFQTERQQITKREVRLTVLAELGLRPYEILWDIGAGSGSVSIEAARTQPTATIIGFEKSAVMAEHFRQNVATHGVFNVSVVEEEVGNWGLGIRDWRIGTRAWGLGIGEQNHSITPSPHHSPPNAIFIGGSGGHLTNMIEMAKDQLAVNGRLVATFATLENLLTAQTQLPDALGYQIQINRLKSIAALTRLEALNPVFLLTWTKT